jgi:lambda family phage portal protein
MRARCRDEIRNNPWAGSAIDNFESQAVGNGIRPHWKLDNTDLKLQIETEFNAWAESSAGDQAGLLSFYGLQALAAREIFEAGEVFIRMYTRPSSWKLRIPLQCQLIESEQVPVFLNIVGGIGGSIGPVGTPKGNKIRTGIEFDLEERRTAYHMYRANPGETMFYPTEGLTYIRIPASDVLHAYKPLRAGMLRGVPMLSVALVTLHDLDKYTDAAVVKKQIQTMFAGFIRKVSPNSDVVPADLSINSALNQQGYQPVPPNVAGVGGTYIEPGTLQQLFEGEDIVFPQLPAEADIETFLRVMLHRFAVSIGATYEQITGDLRGVNYSSIRAGLLDFRRKCEQFQRNILVQMFCGPIVRRWLKEAVLAGVLKLPGYGSNPSLYEQIEWSTPAWAWVDPLKDAQAAQLAVRSGFTSREAIVAEQGLDVTTVDAQQAADNERADGFGLVYDTRPDQILIGRESNPQEEAPEETPEGKKQVEKEEKTA